MDWDEDGATTVTGPAATDTGPPIQMEGGYTVHGVYLSIISS